MRTVPSQRTQRPEGLRRPKLIKIIDAAGFTVQPFWYPLCYMHLWCGFPRNLPNNCNAKHFPLPISLPCDYHAFICSRVLKWILYHPCAFPGEQGTPSVPCNSSYKKHQTHKKQLSRDFTREQLNSSNTDCFNALPKLFTGACNIKKLNM